MPIYQEEQRLARLKLLRHEVDLEIRAIEKGIRRRARLRPNSRRAPVEVAGVQPSVIRAWAIAQGLDVGLRGRIRDDIAAAYQNRNQA